MKMTAELIAERDDWRLVRLSEEGADRTQHNVKFILERARSDALGNTCWIEEESWAKGGSQDSSFDPIYGLSELVMP